jgi:8-oxo-dGTP pyrophosphatase MutT (NUDIX family)
MTAPAEPGRCTSPGRHDGFSRHHVPCSGPASERSRSPDGYGRPAGRPDGRARPADRPGPRGRGAARSSGGLGDRGVGRRFAAAAHEERVVFAPGPRAADADVRPALLRGRADHHPRPVPVVGLRGLPWEIPNGRASEGYELLSAAQRELPEETGYTALQWRGILRAHLCNSVSDESAVCYLATDVRARTASPEGTGQLPVQWVPFETALEMCAEGRITDAQSVLGVQKVALMQRDG